MNNYFITLFKNCVEMGVAPGDSEVLRMKKSSLILVLMVIGLAAFVWGMIFIAIGQYLPASIPLSYAFISLLNLWHYRRTKNIDALQIIQMLLVLFLPFFLMWSLGGFALGSYVMIWAFFAPMAALTYDTKENSLKWFLAFLALVAFSTAIDETLIAHNTNTMPHIVIELFYLLNISAGLSGIFFLIRNYIQVNANNALRRLEIDHRALQRKEKDLVESELRFRQLAENINEVFWLGSPDWRQVFYVSPSIKKVWGIEPEALYVDPRLWMAAVHPEDRERVLADIPTEPDSIGEFVDFAEYRIQGTDGNIVWIKARAYPIRNPEGEVIRMAGIAEDVTARKLSDEKILHQAHFDNLTNLPNRFLSLDRLSQLLIEAGRNNELVAVLFLDLDEFKKINDSLGHDTGDRVLIESAHRLCSVVRSGDTVGRLGGDEFIVLLGDLSDATDARPIAENIINRFRDAFKIENRELMMTVSIGISIFPTDGGDASELLRRADSAMYHSKEIGRNTYSFFTAEMNLEISRRLALEEQLHGALARNEFTVLYQPKLELKNNRVMGAEALLRWNNPALGEISPKEFIPIAEQTGLIIPIGKYVLNEALRAATRWNKSYDQSFRVAVNLSPRQFRESELVSDIEQSLKDFDMAPENLEMEITEGVLMSGHSYINNAIAALSDLGVGITMDDFGTGYSSISYLRKYPFTVIKIDRSFINDINIDEADQKLVDAAIAMAHGLKLKVVAEGVETEEQLATLRGMGCDLGQGFLFGKPVSEEDFTKMLEK